MSNSEEEKYKISRDNIDRPELIKLIYKPKFLLAVVLIYAGLGIPFLLNSQYNLTYFFEKFGPMTLGVISAFLGLTILMGEISKIKKFKREDRFIDVDDNRDSRDQTFQKKILSELNSIKAKSDSFSTDNIEEIVSKAIESKTLDQANMFDSFENYFNEIRRVLLEQAYTSDKKASILLDKGTSYSKGGITFFITSIIVWQVLSWLTGFKEQYIYGMISCSLLFIFIEFLSAWFLKQYRHFVDTSTYHIKVKSIFDKYMMSYLAIKSLGDNNRSDETKYQAMLRVLEEEIKWPESYLLKKSEVSFAREAIETMSHFAKAIKSEAKNKAS
ncbi:TPA: hypothetical protein MH601_05185 [Klebsiella pneumoniae]|nr:hypothetical protein [Klebsiella pneumoniae]